MSTHRPDTTTLTNYTSRPMTVTEVGSLLSMSPNTVKRHAKEGTFGPFSKVVRLTQGGHWRFHPGYIRAYADSLARTQQQRLL